VEAFNTLGAAQEQVQLVSLQEPPLEVQGDFLTKAAEEHSH
jgi:hypothetical protein